MIKIRGTGINQRPLIVFGLEKENIKRLQANDPIYFPLRQLGADLPDVDIMIAAGEDTEQVKREIEQHIDKFHATHDRPE